MDRKWPVEEGGPEVDIGWPEVDLDGGPMTNKENMGTFWCRKGGLKVRREEMTSIGILIKCPISVII